MLADLQMGPNSRYSKGSEGFGTNGNYAPTIVTQNGIPISLQVLAAGGGAVAAQQAGNVSAQVAFNGCDEESIGCEELYVQAGQSYTTFLPLMSSLIGSSASKYLPLFLLGEIMLEIELCNKPTYGVNQANYSISGVELHAQLIEFDGSVNSALSSMALSNGIYMHGVNWMGITSAIGLGDASILVSERLKSIKSIFTTFCVPATTSQMRRFARHNAGLTSYQLKIGSELYPNQAIVGTSLPNGNSEFIMETLKAIGEYTNINHSSIFCPKTFANTGNLAFDCGRACYGLDLDCFSGQRLESGVNTILNNPINVNCAGVNVACDCYIFLMHDVIYSIRPDGVFTVSR
jgi:hypothetical protein